MFAKATKTAVRKNAKVTFVAFVVALIIGLLAPRQATADPCSDKETEASSGKNYKTVTGPDGRKVFVIEKAFVVCGKVPKPNVLYVLQASTINYEWESLKKNFLPKIDQALRKAPF